MSTTHPSRWHQRRAAVSTPQRHRLRATHEPGPEPIRTTTQEYQPSRGSTLTRPRPTRSPPQRALPTHRQSVGKAGRSQLSLSQRSLGRPRRRPATVNSWPPHRSRSPTRRPYPEHVSPRGVHRSGLTSTVMIVLRALRLSLSVPVGCGHHRRDARHAACNSGSPRYTRCWARARKRNA